MYRIYGATLDLPGEVATELDECQDHAFPVIRVERGELPQDDSLESIDWYHQWHTPEGNLWLTAGRCADGWYVLRFDGILFAVSPDGRTIRYLQFADAPIASVRHWLLNQVVPMVLQLHGVEVLHASSVAAEHGAIAFAGDGGYGKSTLAASLVQRGFALISDDAVPLVPRDGEIWTYSGPREMGLWPRARALVGADVAQASNTDKLRVPIDRRRCYTGPIPLSAIYFLQPAPLSETINIAPMIGPAALIELVRAAHRIDITDRVLLRRQLDVLTIVAKQVRLRSVSFPSGLGDLTLLRDAVLADSLT